jgi:hypothetical protein
VAATSCRESRKTFWPLSFRCRSPRMNRTLWNRDECRPVRNVPARLIVWESDGSWARHLRRLLDPDGPRVYETRTSAACSEMVAESPASIVVALWTTSTASELTNLVTRFRHDYPAARIVAVADRAVEPLRWRVLETGIVWLCTSPRELGPVVEIVQRHFDSVPEPPRSPEQRIWDCLPWQGT